jgi:hypothetical protein
LIDQQGDRVEIYAHIDETGTRLHDGRRLYGLAAVLTDGADHALVATTMSGLLLPAQRWLHHYDETRDRRIKIAEALAPLPLIGSIFMSTPTDQTRQEAARAKLLVALLPHLQHIERATRVVMESRQAGDRHDRRTRDRLRRSHRIDAAMPVDHKVKDADPGLWVADFIAGAYIAAHHHDEPEPWEILCAAHVIEVRHVPE